MKKFILLFWLILGALSLSSCTEEEEITQGDIVGVVTDAVNGTQPLSGVQVSILPNGASTSTGSDGKFSFPQLKAGEYKIQFMKEGYETNTKSVTVVPGQVSNADIQLTAVVQDALIQITPSTLNFGTTQNELSVKIQNNGNTSTDWSLDLGSHTWLIANPIAGQIEANKQQSIIFTVDRDKLTETQTAIIKLSAFGNSFPINVSCAPKNAQSYMSVEPEILDFGNDVQELPLTIKNTGNSTLNWSIASPSEPAITLSENSGSITAKGSKVVKVFLNRNNGAVNINTTLVLSDGIKEQAIQVVSGSESQTGIMNIEPEILDFGKDINEASFTISNTGKGELSWNIEEIKENSLTVTPTEGKITAGSSQTVNVQLDRDKMPEELNATLNVSDGKTHKTIQITGQKDNSPSLVVGQGLYAYYKFDGDFNDMTENAINGFGNNSPSFVEGITEGSQAVKFSLTDNSSFIVPKAITDSRTLTVSFWGKDFSDGNIFYLVSSNNNASMFTFTMSQGSLKFVTTRYNNEYQYSNRPAFTHPTITDGKWHHIALVSDFNNIEYATTTTSLYVDGVLVDTITEYVNPFEEGTHSQASYGTGIKFIMGGNVTIERKTVNGTNMTIDNFRVYNTRCLSDKEIKQIYDAKQ
ncbi:MAG TPA: carboxypeptidase regulatory-like domain-containing protein [Bacteroides mediterraneensis]|uniref:BACON domain-containing protein n=1 Tax=Bacteroides mediterraneensis TaxID=1841856 RepID=UPI00261C790C|nr:carboxypeptidase regulatory-like domain-containing protein [Bacteroides mediterraneensis]HJH63433.1 carboxypeptidase regulatory-like domain-containing protein [Bacteroides mediterraneensis]